MKNYVVLRLSGVAALLLVLQQAMLLAHPEWRTGDDIYLVWLLILSASRGPLTASVFALAGGMVMDAGSSHFAMFHMLFYLVPVALGALFRSQMIVEYGLLGGLAAAGLLLLKVFVMLLAGIASGLLSGPQYLLRLNYWPVLLVSLAVALAWRWLVGLAQPLKVASVGR